MKKKILIPIIIAAVAVSAIGVCYFKASEPKSIVVKTATASFGTVSDYLSTTGVVKSENSKDYYGPQGKVKKVNVSVGDEVKKGDVLIEFDIDDLSATIKQAEIQYNNAVLSKDIILSSNKTINNKISEINSEINKINKRISDLESLEDDSVLGTIAELKSQKKVLEQSKEALSPASSEQLKQADNAIALAKANLDQVKNSASKLSSKIVADFDGVVTNLYVVEGAVSSGAQVMCTVQDIKDLKVRLAVGKYDSKLIELGQKAVLNIEDTTINGEVSFISPTASSNQGESSLTVDVTLDGYHEYLKVDFSEDIDILVNEAINTIRVPMESIKYSKDGTALVYKVVDGIAKEVPVTIGVESDSFVEITKGLELDDEIILNPGDNIKDGVLVSTGEEVNS